MIGLQRFLLIILILKMVFFGCVVTYAAAEENTAGLQIAQLGRAIGPVGVAPIGPTVVPPLGSSTILPNGPKLSMPSAPILSKPSEPVLSGREGSHPNSKSNQNGGLPNGESFGTTLAVAVCITVSDTADDCLERGKLLDEARSELKTALISNYIEGYRDGLVRVGFPGQIEKVKQFEFLREAENKAISFAVARIKADMGKLEAFKNDREEDKRKKMILIQNTATQLQMQERVARSQANDGSSWSSNSSENTYSYTNPPEIYQFSKGFRESVSCQGVNGKSGCGESFDGASPGHIGGSLYGR